ncbi:glycosyltransferase family 2 protein [Hufsiella ginkgonis]|uniref:Glycosyltransferase n=1 Tax=Hufsiella ginkgonis TaxID=2695274 RepID=A0A7K1Y2E8_9SPHI|nr:glycosyltransferase family 2 protein [Hufsiella ginkgonis]MXV17382.1 glycosyltransferase [Hufsiella ginkgonis]
MQVSIIIVNYNTAGLCIQCIGSVKKLITGLEYEIIVVDNASAGDSCLQITDAFPEVKLLRNQENLGFGRANNLGIEQAAGEYLFLLNSDTWLLNNAPAIFYHFMELPQNKQVGCCGGALFKPGGEGQAAYGNFPSLLEAFSYLGFYRLYKSYFRQHISPGVVNTSPADRPVDYISGADMFIRRQALTETGTFDPDFFLYFEETELSFRFKKKRWLSFIVPEAKIVHLEGASQQQTGTAFNPVKETLFMRSRKHFFVKCYGRVSATVMKILYGTSYCLSGILGRDKNWWQKLKILSKT